MHLLRDTICIHPDCGADTGTVKDMGIFYVYAYASHFLPVQVRVPVALPALHLVSGDLSSAPVEGPGS